MGIDEYCTNCDGRECMDCVMRTMHDECKHSCPECGPDSLNIDTYDSGMVRSASDGRPRFDLLYPEGIPYPHQFMTRMAQRLADGAASYGDRNWERSNSNVEIARAKESAGRHYAAWMAGDTDDDHAAALAVNLLFAESITYWVRTQS